MLSGDLPQKVYVAGCPNTSSEQTQLETELLLAEHYNAVLAPQLCRKNHAYYCKSKMRDLPEWTQGLHCSRPWLIYWTLHAADLLGALPELYTTVASPTAIRHMLQLCFNYDLAAEEIYASSVAARGNDSESESSKGEPHTNNRRRRCGGFGGGPGQMPHLAASYAAIMSLHILEETKRIAENENDNNKNAEASKSNACSSDESHTNRRGFNYKPTKEWESIVDVPWESVSNWFESLALDASKNESLFGAHDGTTTNPLVNNGGFSMHIGGECDVRASYIVATVAATIGRIGGGAFFPRKSTRAYINLDSWGYVLRCQRYEGGFSCGPLSPEVHGGYGQCALSALVYWYPLLVADALYDYDENGSSSSSKGVRLPNINELRRWLTQRQMALEGGFQGRTNKLVDSCYSHWIGTTFVLVEVIASLAKALEGVTLAVISPNSSSARQRAAALLPRLLENVGCFDFGYNRDTPVANIDTENSSSNHVADGYFGAEFAVLDALNLSSASLIDLENEGGCTAVLRALNYQSGKATDETKENDIDTESETLADWLADTDGTKVSAVEGFLADAADAFSKEAYVYPLATTNFAALSGSAVFHQPTLHLSGEEGEGDDDRDQDSLFEDLDEGQLISEAIARYTHDGAGTLLCNQRALQQYVLKFCQEVNVPSACAPQPAVVGSVPLAEAADDDVCEPSSSSSADGAKEELMREALAAAIKASSASAASGLGGLMDKPDHPNDSYHTCYSMSGMASMQQGALLALLKHTTRRAAATAAHAPCQKLVEAIEELQVRGLLPTSDTNTTQILTDALSTFAPPASSTSSSFETIPVITTFAAGYDGLVVGRVEEDALYFDALLGPNSAGRSELMAPVQVKREVEEGRISDAPIDAMRRVNPNRANQHSVLSPLNPMANIAARHFIHSTRRPSVTKTHSVSSPLTEK